MTQDCEYLAELFSAYHLITPPKLEELFEKREQWNQTQEWKRRVLTTLRIGFKEPDISHFWLKSRQETTRTIVLFREDHKTDRWSWDYELRMANVINDEEKIRARKDTFSFQSRQSINDILEQYIARYGGEKNCSRVGNIAVYERDQRDIHYHHLLFGHQITPFLISRANP